VKKKTVYVVVISDRSLRSFPSTYGPFSSRPAAVNAAAAFIESLADYRRKEYLADVRPLRDPRLLLATVKEMMGL